MSVPSSPRLEEYGIDPTTNERLKVIRKENQRGEKVVYHVGPSGKLHGTWKTFTPNGKQLLEECVYKNGIFHGPMLSYHPNGAKAFEANFMEGRQEGLFQKWSDQGILLEKKFYKNGQLEGEEEIWYLDGKPCQKATYKDGKREGRLQYWTPSGKLYLL